MYVYLYVHRHIENSSKKKVLMNDKENGSKHADGKLFLVEIEKKYV